MNVDPKQTSAERMKALRIALGFRLLADLSSETAKHGKQISEGSLRGYETLSRGVPKDEDVRRALAAALGLPLDAFSAYLAGRVDRDATVALSSRTSATVPPTSDALMPTGPLLRNHPDWADLCAQAIESDRNITAQDLREIGAKPFLYGPLEKVGVEDVVGIARMHRRLRGRA
jgi:hypothetical protein